MFEFILPDVGEGMHEAEIVRWLVKPGERVKVDQAMLEIQTDKAVVEIPAPVEGMVSDIRVKEGQMAVVGSVLVTFDTGVTPPKAPAVQASPALNNQSVSAVSAQHPSRVRAAPAVRKRAVELGVDLTQVPPSSPDGRILLADVLSYAEQQQAAVHDNSRSLNGGTGATGALPDTLVPLDNEAPNSKALTEASVLASAGAPVASGGVRAPSMPPPTPDETGGEERKPLVGLRRRIAERMELSWRTIPHVSVFDEASAEQLQALRQRLLPLAEKQGVKLTYLPFIIKATCQLLKRYPIFNSSLDEQRREIIYRGEYHIGVATATPDGLLVPVVRHADRLTLLEVAAEIARLAEGARTRSLKPHELSGSTFTITNFGSYGGRMGTAIINPPEAAILGIGQIADRVEARDGQAVVRPVLPFTLSFDHRLIDGADSGQFMSNLRQLLENPELLLLNMS